ncbi:hypothetical protein AV530_015334 [Patagioenas fasciata monilis]|uniref:Uncharacterized protein n=1 Tax=Patagioenas fasciata monilis TaxID=372326 RepID=A0A1V4K1Y9_PATFA|nr:hypothetical protein AV530_015334 [Patagioenas fasciata monilis]
MQQAQHIPLVLLPRSDSAENCSCAGWTSRLESVSAMPESNCSPAHEDQTAVRPPRADIGEFFSRGRTQQSWDAHESQTGC